MNRRVTSLAIAGLVLVSSMATSAQQATRVSTILTAFLVDSGVAARGLPWNTGSELPVTWETDGPVNNTFDPYLLRRGMTLFRSGRVSIELEGASPQELSVQVVGDSVGIQRISVGLVYEPNGPSPLDLIKRSLLADGFQLDPLKCSRATEGTIFGNVALVAKAPGKKASGLWEMWNCGHDSCGLTPTILYRKSDLSEVECYAGL